MTTMEMNCNSVKEMANFFQSSSVFRKMIVVCPSSEKSLNMFSLSCALRTIPCLRKGSLWNISAVLTKIQWNLRDSTPLNPVIRLAGRTHTHTHTQKKKNERPSNSRNINLAFSTFNQDDFTFFCFLFFVSTKNNLLSAFAKTPKFI